MVRQNSPTAKKVSRSKPAKEKLLAFSCDEEISGEAFRKQEKMVGRVTLVCDHRIGDESTLRCSCQDCLVISRSQSIEEVRPQARGYRSNPRGRYSCVSLSGNGPSPSSRGGSGKTIPSTLVKESRLERHSSGVGLS